MGLTVQPTPQGRSPIRRPASAPRRAGLDWAAALQSNGAYDFFDPLGDLLLWGPTGTNVGDVHVMLIGIPNP